MSPSDYVFVLCAAGAETALKDEVTRRGLDWASSFQRPGFVTFKRSGTDLPELVFARERAISLGSQRLGEDGIDVQKLAHPEAARLLSDPSTLIRVSARVPELAERARVLSVRSGASTRAPVEGDPTLELVLVEPDEVWIGAYRFDRTHCPHAGGWWPELLPEGAPSRAYAKLAAVLARFELAPRADESAIELGSSPGGATFLLLERGLSVVGVDPAEMDPRIVAHPRFRHLRTSVAALDRQSLPKRIDWLLADMNVAPKLTLRHARALAEHLRPRAIVLTLKLKQWERARAIPDWIADVRSWGYSEVHAAQLSPHRQEIALVAWHESPAPGREEARKGAEDAKIRTKEI